MANFDGWDLAGYGGPGFWVDFENGDRDPVDLSDPDAYTDLEDGTEFVVSYLDSDKELHYYTFYDYFLDIEAMEAVIDDLSDQYGLE